MAKDGTSRGGSRSGSGKKQNSKIQRILDGVQARSLEFGAGGGRAESEDQDLAPEIPEWAVMKQEGSIDCGDKSVEIPALRTQAVFSYVWNFLNSLGVVQFVNLHMVLIYSMSVARYIQCEEIISMVGLTAAHPTTGATTASPFVAASQNYLKSANSIWFQISQIVKDNWEGSISTETKRNDTMDFLLIHRPGN